MWLSRFDGHRSGIVSTGKMTKLVLTNCLVLIPLYIEHNHLTVGILLQHMRQSAGKPIRLDRHWWPSGFWCWWNPGQTSTFAHWLQGVMVEWFKIYLVSKNVKHGYMVGLLVSRLGLWRHGMTKGHDFLAKAIVVRW